MVNEFMNYSSKIILSFKNVSMKFVYLMLKNFDNILQIKTRLA